MYLLASIHDVAPGKAREVAGLRRLLRGHGIDRIALLTVPEWHGRESLEDHPGFVSQLQSWVQEGDEILLHGLAHLEDPGGLAGGPFTRLRDRLLTAGEGEFLRLDHAEARRRLIEGRERLTRLGLRPRGFVAPAWLYSPGTRAALRDLQWLYEDALYLWQKSGRRCFSPVLSLSVRTPARLAASALWCEALSLALRRQRVVRVGLHPMDERSPTARRLLERTILRLRRTHRPMSYGTVDRLL